MKYSIDTNALIDCWRRRYPRDIFPGLWMRIEEHIQSGTLIATEEVFHELEKVDDDLLVWSKTFRQMFISIDVQIQQEVRSLLEQFAGLINVNKSSSMADPFVIVLAMVHRCTVVTNERYSYNIDKPKIPDVCKAKGIRVIDLLTFIKEQNWTFS